jgi:hypothetical protein
VQRFTLAAAATTTTANVDLANTGVWTPAFVETAAGDKLGVSVYVKPSAEVNLSTGIYAYTAAQAGIASTDGPGVKCPAGVWTRVTATVTVTGATTRWARADLNFAAAAQALPAGFTLDVDGLLVEKADTVGAWFDGDSPGCEWVAGPLFARAWLPPAETAAQLAADAAADVAVTLKTVSSNVEQQPDKILAQVASTYVTQTRFTQVTDAAAAAALLTDQGLDVKISKATERVEQVNGAVVAETQARETLIRLGSAGVEVGESKAPTKTVYGASGLSIQVNGAEVASYLATGGVISDMTVQKTLRIGNRVWEPSPTGGMWVRKA